jgi:hypothetical protein
MKKIIDWFCYDWRWLTRVLAKILMRRMAIAYKEDAILYPELKQWLEIACQGTGSSKEGE